MAEKKKKFETNKDNIAEVLQEFIFHTLKDEEYYSRIGVVKSVNDEEKTAEIELINGDILDDVRLQQVASNSGIFYKPSVNSVVLISFTDKTTAYISLFSQLDEIIFQGGENGGLIKIQEQTDKINELVGYVNDLYNLLQTWTVVPQDGGLALQTAALLLTSPPDLDKSDFENEKFKH
jgi:hypothetical protein